MTTCKIQWVDRAGMPTPDNNEAIGRVKLPARTQQFHGRAMQFTESEWFPICACHAEQLSKPGMDAWIFEATAS